MSCKNTRGLEPFVSFLDFFLFVFCVHSSKRLLISFLLPAIYCICCQRNLNIIHVCLFSYFVSRIFVTAIEFYNNFMDGVQNLKLGTVQSCFYLHFIKMKTATLASQYFVWLEFEDLIFVNFFLLVFWIMILDDIYNS